MTTRGFASGAGLTLFYLVMVIGAIWFLGWHIGLIR
jgi:hypothetical protein